MLQALVSSAGQMLRELGASLYRRQAFHPPARSRGPGKYRPLQRVASLAELGAGKVYINEGAGQVFLARRLPDYWQRLERHQTAYATARLDAPGPKGGWLGRLFGG